MPLDGKVLWDSYKMQFEMLSYMNQWEEPEKSAYLAISLRGPAMGVLSNLTPEQRRDYKALSTALDIRFGEAHQVELSRVQLRSRVRRRDESLPELAENIERLTRLAYPNAAVEMIEVLAKDQFIDALHAEEMRLKVRQSRPSTLRQALEASLELESFELASRRGPRIAREATLEAKELDSVQPEQTAMQQLMELVRRTQRDPQQEHRGTGRQNRQRQERTLVCWRCGKNGHMRRDCHQPVPPDHSARQDVSQSGNEQ